MSDGAEEDGCLAALVGWAVVFLVMTAWLCCGGVA